MYFLTSPSNKLKDLRVLGSRAAVTPGDRGQDFGMLSRLFVIIHFQLTTNFNRLVRTFQSALPHDANDYIRHVSSVLFFFSSLYFVLMPQCGFQTLLYLINYISHYPMLNKKPALRQTGHTLPAPALYFLLCKAPSRLVCILGCRFRVLLYASCTACTSSILFLKRRGVGVFRRASN